MMIYCDELSCPKCKIRKMIWVKGTLLCPHCDSSVIWDLQTPWTTEEESNWVNRNISVNKNDRKNSKT